MVGKGVTSSVGKKLFPIYHIKFQAPCSCILFHIFFYIYIFFFFIKEKYVFAYFFVLMLHIKFQVSNSSGSLFFYNQQHCYIGRVEKGHNLVNISRNSLKS